MCTSPEGRKLRLIKFHKLRMEEKHSVDQRRSEEGRKESPALGGEESSTGRFSEEVQADAEVWPDALVSPDVPRSLSRSARSLESEL